MYQHCRFFYRKILHEKKIGHGGTLDPDVSDFADAIKMAKENGNEGLYIADSIEELAEKAGIDVDNLVDTVEEYNDFCDSVDEEFFKDKRYLRPITKAPFYGARIRP